ncbi:hypothetical protein E3N88_06865 [Mikania micrantha]|uniref:Uncharacterized protein n=1 Tax=Mikania micrantha TaxID=192012 RepID=A0A5N6PST0_9ASTR|nr:hypothetical protein E3N88_06865 [Mikania micrantha]
MSRNDARIRWKLEKRFKTMKLGQLGSLWTHRGTRWTPIISIAARDEFSGKIESQNPPRYARNLFSHCHAQEHHWRSLDRRLKLGGQEGRLVGSHHQHQHILATGVPFSADSRSHPDLFKEHFILLTGRTRGSVHMSTSLPRRISRGSGIWWSRYMLRSPRGFDPRPTGDHGTGTLLPLLFGRGKREYLSYLC